MESNIPWSEIPSGLQVAIIVYGAIQLAVQVWALVDLLRTPAERLQTGKKWLWAIVVLFFNMLGAIIYFVAGKKPAEAVDPARASAPGAPTTGAPAADRATRAAELLYGDQDAGGDAR
ncbi:MAG: PLD nuclease N-terminal domain-containing protein [Anaerosomatales bacterium]|nr:PLD nuclease N-terminal domain-containing protein [Anaerosomatales bacterium]